jgi:CheY-like chemotaxis protein
MKIFHYDDHEDDLQLISRHFNKMTERLGVKLEVTCESSIKKTFDILEKESFDLIILDMVDQRDNSETGLKIIDYLKEHDRMDPVLIYTSIDRSSKDYTLRIDRYPHIVDYLNKSEDPDIIRRVFRDFLESNGFIPKIYGYDKDDYEFKAEMYNIGEKDIISILQRIKMKILENEKKQIFPLDKENRIFILNKATKGMSGASIFKVEYKLNGNSKSFLLKVSKNKENIRKELQNIGEYKKLDHRLRLDYNYGFQPKELETENISAICIECENNAITLFDWLYLKKENSDKIKIEKFFNDLYYSYNLNDFYSDNKSTDPKKINYIFEKLGDERITFIKKTIHELEPIWKFDKNDEKRKTFIENTIPNQEYILDGDNIKIIYEKCFNDLLFHHSYEHIDKNNIHNKNINEKELILCHGDFHARNILVSNSELPSIIDTGGFGYDYWSTDIARLIVHLFLEGFDYDTYEFYSIESQIARFKIAKEIIIDGRIVTDSLEQRNLGFAYAINWLLDNVENIYGEISTTWEFQFNLGLEFLKFSYKNLILPPGKRVLALMAACESVRQANTTLGELSKK